MEPLLTVEGLRLAYGGVVACDDVSFEVRRGEILGLIGPNGAGKTTVFNCITRVVRPDRGQIRIGSTSLIDRTERSESSLARRHEMPPYRVRDAGIARTFQAPALFGSMTVQDNLLVGQQSLLRSGLFATALGLPSVRREHAEAAMRAEAMLDRLGLLEFAHRPVASLSVATQKRVELARALVTKPSLLLLDEPAAGLSHEEVAMLGDLIRRLRDELSLTVLLIEHHMGLVMSLCDRVVVLSAGRVIAQGTPHEVANAPAVVEAYLGSDV